MSPDIPKAMTRSLINPSILLAAAVVVACGCSTMSRTEKQLSRVDSFESPDIPAIGELPPVRPQQTGLMYSKNTLIISYDEGIGKVPLQRAVRKYGAEVIYDYRIISALAVRIPDGKTLDESIEYFEKVKGVVSVSKDRIYQIDDPKPQLELL